MVCHADADVSAPGSGHGAGVARPDEVGSSGAALWSGGRELTSARADPTIEVTLGRGTPAVMTPELAEELMAKLDVHLGHIHRFRERREGSTRR